MRNGTQESMDALGLRIVDLFEKAEIPHNSAVITCLNLIGLTDSPNYHVDVDAWLASSNMDCFGEAMRIMAFQFEKQEFYSAEELGTDTEVIDDLLFVEPVGGGHG